jgi:O-acetylhomoserine/O-acetylserine sulfhydrylase-like pyridoxal-dependent enzyme
MTHSAKHLSPLRNSTTESDPGSLAKEQAVHFGIDPDSEFGMALVELATHLYSSYGSTQELWRITTKGLAALDRTDRIAWFNAKRFIAFQLAKILDDLQNPLRSTYQSLVTRSGGFSSKGVYPLFDNVTALFAANPVITRTATYMFACTEWIEDAFTGREPLHHIYSRLLNPTSISLANHIVDVECGKRADEYMAWNFNSGLAAIDGVLSHMVGHRDVLVVSRNVYGGSYQLIHDWYGKSSNLDVGLVWVDGYDAESFAAAMDQAEIQYKDRLADERQIYTFVESPCNPHGLVLDVAGISRVTHERGWRIIVDTTVGTPFLCPVLRQEDPADRPDFVVHSYTKELAGFGSTTAGCVIGRNEDMFIPKGEEIETTDPVGNKRVCKWDETLFWNVYYVKGAFLDSEKAFEVMTGMKTFEMRVVKKAVNTLVVARVLNYHPNINVSCPAVPSSPNHAIFKKNMRLGLPASLFTFDLESSDNLNDLSPATFKRFFDMLEPSVGLQVTLGQTNTVALCPALTSHSELSAAALAEAGITPTTTRLSVGLEDPRIFIGHLKQAASMSIEDDLPGFVGGFPTAAEIDKFYEETYIEVHTKYVQSLPGIDELSS